MGIFCFKCSVKKTLKSFVERSNYWGPLCWGGSAVVAAYPKLLVRTLMFDKLTVAEKRKCLQLAFFPLLSAGQSRSRELILVRISSKYLGYQVAPINRDFSGTAERLRLIVCRFIADYHGREFHHYSPPTLWFSLSTCCLELPWHHQLVLS